MTDDDPEDNRLPVHRLARWLSAREDSRPDAWPRGVVLLLGAASVTTLIVIYSIF